MRVPHVPLNDDHNNFVAEHGKLAQWLAESNLPELAMQCTHDGEAYVRASALSALKHLITLPPLQHMTQVNIVISEKPPSALFIFHR